MTGPGKGGPHGPYRQSERTEIYGKLVEELVQKGVAFPCFCSDLEIEQARKDAQERNLPPVYRGKWAQASAEVPHPPPCHRGVAKCWGDAAPPPGVYMSTPFLQTSSCTKEKLKGTEGAMLQEYRMRDSKVMSRARGVLR